MAHITRRQSIAALVLGGGVAAAGLGLIVGGEEALVASIVRRVVGPYKMSGREFGAFMRDLDTPVGSAARVKFALYRTFSATEPDTLLRFAPTGIKDGFSTYERRVVTNFLTRTDYLAVGKDKEVTFNGEAGCRNPFAKLDVA